MAELNDPAPGLRAWVLDRPDAATVAPPAPAELERLRHRALAEMAVTNGDRDLAGLCVLDTEVVETLVTRGTLVDAAVRAVTSGVALDAIDADLLACDPPTGSMGHERRAHVRREIELASRVLSPPDEPDPLSDAQISVVVTAHDVGPWIGQTLASIADQDPVLDLVVVVDASVDETLDVVLRFARTHPLRLVRTRLRGGAHARNVGAALATAPYLLFCDGDDLVAPDGYAALLRAAQRSEAPMVVGQFLKFRPDSTWRPMRRRPAYKVPGLHEDISSAPTLIYHRACWNKLFSTSWWQAQDLLFPEVVRSNDIVPMVRAYLSARPFEVIEDAVYVYRQRPGASSMTSGVGTGASLGSYLEQEAECAALVLAHPDPGLHREYARTVLAEDAWIQTGRYLRGCHADGTAPDPEVLRRCHALVDTFPVEHFFHLPMSARLLFAAALLDDSDTLMAAALTDSRDPATLRARGWATLLTGDLPDSELLPPRDHLWAFGVVPTLDDLLDDDGLDAEETGQALTELVRAISAPEHREFREGIVDPVVTSVLDLSSIDPVEHVRAVRVAKVKATFAERVERGRLEVRGTSAADRVVRAFVGGPDGRLHEVPLRSEGTMWAVTLDRRSVPRGRNRLLVEVASEHGRTSLAHVRNALDQPWPSARWFEPVHLRPEIGPANIIVDHRTTAWRFAARARHVTRRRR